MEQTHQSIQDDASYLRERTSNITEELKQVLAPSLGTITFKLAAAAPQISDERQSLRDFYTGELVPYRFANIPPDFFGSEEPHHFDSQDELTAHVETYWQKDDARASKYGLEPQWIGRMRRIVGEGLARTLIRGASAVDLSGWDDYRSLGVDMSRGSRLMALNTFYSALVWPQAEADGYFDYFPDQNEAALITNTSLLATGAPAASLLRVPIMLDDVAFTRRFMNACVSATMLVANNERAYAGFEELLESDDNRELIHRHVQRASPQGGTKTPEYDASKLHHMSVEAVQSVTAVYALLAKEQPEGYPYDGARLIEDLHQQNIVDKFAKLIPFGFIGPTSLFGRYIPNLLYAKKDDKYGYRLRFTPEAKQSLQVYSDHITTLFADKWRAYDIQSVDNPDLFPPVQTGTRCPFAGKTRDALRPRLPISSVIANYSYAVATIFRLLNEPTPDEIMGLDGVRAWKWEFKPEIPTASVEWSNRKAATET